MRSGASPRPSFPMPPRLRIRSRRAPTPPPPPSSPPSWSLTSLSPSNGKTHGLKTSCSAPRLPIDLRRRGRRHRCLVRPHPRPLCLRARHHFGRREHHLRRLVHLHPYLLPCPRSRVSPILSSHCSSWISWRKSGATNSCDNALLKQTPYPTKSISAAAPSPTRR